MKRIFNGNATAIGNGYGRRAPHCNLRRSNRDWSSGPYKYARGTLVGDPALAIATGNEDLCVHRDAAGTLLISAGDDRSMFFVIGLAYVMAHLQLLVLFHRCSRMRGTRDIWRNIFAILVAIDVFFISRLRVFTYLLICSIYSVT